MELFRDSGREGFGGETKATHERVAGLPKEKGRDDSRDQAELRFAECEQCLFRRHDHVADCEEPDPAPERIALDTAENRVWEFIDRPIHVGQQTSIRASLVR